MFKGIFSSSKGSPSKTASGQQRPPKSPTKTDAPAFPPRATSMSAAWAIPPFSHPSPERRVGILVTQQGLVVFPKSSSFHTSQAALQTSSSPPTSSSSTFGSGDGFKVASLGSSNSSNASASHGRGAGIASSSLDAGFFIRWNKEAEIVPLQPTAWRSIVDQHDEDDQLECHGLIGISKMFSSSYLFIITSSKAIGTYFHATRPVFCCTGVVAIPLLQPEATQAVQALIAKMSRPSVTGPGTTPTSETSDDTDGDDDSDFDDVETPAAISKEPFFTESASGSRLDTLRMPKSRPWLAQAARAVSDGRMQPSLSNDGESHEMSDVAINSVDVPKPENQVTQSAEDQWHTAKQVELEEKVVRETAKHFARGEFWFSYDFDLTTSLQRKSEALGKASTSASDAALATSSTISSATGKSNSPSSTKQPEFPTLQEPYANLPLWRRADRRFWHNEHMCKDLIKAGLHAYILPVMQGYIQTVALPLTPVASDSDAPSDVVRCQMMVISRRSKERAGLRYQRRGINEAGQVANYVETEQIVYVLRKGDSSSLAGDVLSFVQFRGSIPLFWSQSPFTLKPPPMLERGPEENLAACTKHFSAQVERYGVVTCINLAEQSGKEGTISEAYRNTVRKLADQYASDDPGSAWRRQVKYVDFDFHKECSGMRFENVRKLIDQMQDTLGQMQYFHQQINTASSKPYTQVKLRQKGAFRVSCLDCLDRTNVVQSAFARHVLAHQFGTLGIRVSGPSSTGAAA